MPILSNTKDINFINIVTKNQFCRDQHVLAISKNWQPKTKPTFCISNVNSEQHTYSSTNFQPLQPIDIV